MSKIRIKYFGPIKEGFLENDGWLEINKVTLFIGNQGSGKSVAAKLISTFSWIEKALTRGDSYLKILTNSQQKFLPFKYHRLENYFQRRDKGIISSIEYKGDSYEVNCINGEWSTKEVLSDNYQLPQIMYVPAERNFISYVNDLRFYRSGSVSDSLTDFLTEFNRAKNELKESLTLPINKVHIIYNRVGDKLLLKGNDFSIPLNESSSGFQSLVPLYIVTRFLANSITTRETNPEGKMRIEQRELFRKQINSILENSALTEEQKRITITELSKKFNKTAFINIVEEPEQNLFPSSQRNILNSLLEFNNMNIGNKLVMTTHSPYLINYLTLSVKADSIYQKLRDKGYKLGDLELSHINEIVPMSTATNFLDLGIYEMDEFNGTIKKLPGYNGLPSDENYLNQTLSENNELFAQLLEIQQAI